MAAAASIAAIAAVPGHARQSAARTVLVDIGHSTSAPGSVSASGTGEFRFNLALGLAIADALRRRGVKVVVPNADGRTTSLSARPAAATRAGASLMLSIHHDAIQPSLQPQRERYSGFSIWTSGSAPAAAASASCARAIGGTLAAGGMKPALFHAERIPGEGRNLLDPSIGWYRRDDLAVLRLSRTPAVLLEAGVIVNPAEEAWISRSDVRAAIADRVAEAVVRCIGG